jgi:16S rRNA (cytosine967-C5)-methyltransferase
LLGDIAGKTAVDMCAAPGGKAMQLAAAGAQVTALDLSAKRMVRVTENLVRTRLKADTIVADALKWKPEVLVDIVLLDAPCLSTGTIRRHPDLPYLKSEDQLNKLILLQKDLLSAAAGMIKPGGTMIYCVCSLEREEGEGQIRQFLDDHPSFNITPVLAVEIGGIDEVLLSDGTIQSLPCHGQDWGGLEGFYIARLRKN